MWTLICKISGPQMTVPCKTCMWKACIIFAIAACSHMIYASP